MNCVESDSSEFVEVDPTGRYGRYNEVLGKGASKTVYRAFDEFEGIEVAWNQVKLYDFLQSPEDLERLYCEIHLLRTLKHKNIMKFYSSWVDTTNRNINFITEMFTSGTLRQYRQKHKRVNIRAVKHWCRQILSGLLYLHSLDPPVIHRDLKCDNIFINGNQGVVKIGDLGLAAILRKSHAAHCVGTPEFMAPEVYQEEYNELVDIYSFGMCILEMVTFEYPYSECTHPAQIYKKVINGKKPDALYKVKDPEVRRFVDKCLATVSLRLPARELLNDPFLQCDEYGAALRPLKCSTNHDGMGPLIRQPLMHSESNVSSINDYYNELYLDVGLEPKKSRSCQSVDTETNGVELFTYNEEEHAPNLAITIKGNKEDDEIFLKLRIADREGRIRNIYFPFDIEADTALSVATEMVTELELTDHDVTKIAEMIDGEITLLVPEWQTGPGIVETPRYSSAKLCHNCASNRTSSGSHNNHLSSDHPSAKNSQVLPCSKNGCASLRGRFEEITYQVDESEDSVTEGAPVVSGQSDGAHYTEIWARDGGHEICSEGSGEPNYETKKFNSVKEECVIDTSLIVTSFSVQPDSNIFFTSLPGNQAPPVTPTSSCGAEDDYENEIRQELRWITSKFQMELRDLKSGRLGGHSRTPSWSPYTYNDDKKTEKPITCSPVSPPLHWKTDKLLLKSFGSGKHISCYYGPLENSCPNSETQRARHCEAPPTDSFSPEHIVTAKSFFEKPIVPPSLPQFL